MRIKEMNTKALIEFLETQPSNGGNIAYIAVEELLREKACIEKDILTKKELIDYYKQSLREQEPKKFVIDIFNRDSSGKYHSIITAFALELDEIRTDHICLVNRAYQQGYEIYIYDNTSKRSYNIRDLTDKELKPHHNILANHFNSYDYWRFRNCLK